STAACASPSNVIGATIPGNTTSSANGRTGRFSVSVIAQLLESYGLNTRGAAVLPRRHPILRWAKCGSAHDGHPWHARPMPRIDPESLADDDDDVAADVDRTHIGRDQHG